jgi:hypothetical protein
MTAKTRRGSVIEAKTPRSFGTARILAIALMALAVSGLAYLRFAPDGGAVSVPKGAHAGQLKLDPCHYSTEKGSYVADLAGYGLAQRVDDLEAARRALGYGRIDLPSESAGTRTAMIYSWRYPKSIHRSVMIGVNPPGHFLWDAKTTDEQIRKYSALCAKDDSCRKRTDDLAAARPSPPPRTKTGARTPFRPTPGRSLGSEHGSSYRTRERSCSRPASRTRSTSGTATSSSTRRTT